jgi:hypothetical protein
MFAQSVLPFKLEITRDEITPHAGLAMFGEFAQAMGVPSLLDRALPGPGSGAGYRPSQFVEPLILMLHGGGRSLEDIRQLRMDTGLRDLLQIGRLPSSDAVGDWLRRMGDGLGLAKLGKVNREIIRRALNREDRTDYTLDIDATQIVAEKKSAKKTYKGEIGYMPIVGHLADNGLVIGDEFREGNDAPGARNPAFIKHCAAQMPAGKRVAHFRANSAAYQADIFNFCEESKMTFAIGADLDSSVLAAIRKIGQKDWTPFRDGAIAQTVHTMNKTKNSFRLVVIRRPVQQDLFNDDGPRKRYAVIASNRDESAKETVRRYNRRGETSENRLKELKIGFGMERMPCGQFGANAMFFRIGILAYNLFVMFKKNVLPESWRKHQVQTIRWRLYQAAGKVTSHAGSLWLKVKRCMFALLEEIRARNFELASE